jgi:hypothetical protein
LEGGVQCGRVPCEIKGQCVAEIGDGLGEVAPEARAWAPTEREAERNKRQAANDGDALGRHGG